jgi:hypothetical protein
VHRSVGLWEREVLRQELVTKLEFFVIGALILCAGADVVVIGLALTGTLGFVEAGDIGPVASDTGRLIGTSKPANQLGL